MDAENKGKSFGVGGYRGRIIFLGDGTEVLTDSDDTEMFDNADEDKDLESQVSKNNPTSNEQDAGSSSKAGTAAPESRQDQALQSKTSQSTETASAAASEQQDEKKETKAESTSDESKKE